MLLAATKTSTLQIRHMKGHTHARKPRRANARPSTKVWAVHFPGTVAATLLDTL